VRHRTGGYFVKSGVDPRRCVRASTRYADIETAAAHLHGMLDALRQAGLPDPGRLPDTGIGGRTRTCSTRRYLGAG